MNEYMAGSNRFKFASEFVKKRFIDGEEVGLIRLRDTIRIYLVSQEKSIDEYCKLMLDVGLIEDINNGHFILHHEMPNL
jgi:hypothetical protein